MLACDSVDNVLAYSSALYLAVYFDLEGVAKVLLSQAGAASLHFAASPKCCLQTPLQTAWYLGRIGMARILLQYGANVNERY